MKQHQPGSITSSPYARSSTRSSFWPVKLIGIALAFLVHARTRIGWGTFSISSISMAPFLEVLIIYLRNEGLGEDGFMTLWCWWNVHLSFTSVNSHPVVNKPTASLLAIIQDH